MKFIYIILLFACSECYCQNVVSRFEKDGKIWISTDRKDADTQVFRPIETIYQCQGKFIDLITDTAFSKNKYKIYFGKKWVEVNIPDVGPNGKIGFAMDSKGNMVLKTYSSNRSVFADHIMFHVMAACIDDKFIYCQCGAIFPIANKNF